MHIHYDKSRQFYYVKHYTAAGTVRRTKLEGVTTEEEAQAMVDAMQLKELEFAAKFRQTERGKPLQKTLARILQKMVHSDPAPSGDALIRAFADHLTNVRRFVPSTVQNMCYTVGQFATWLKEMKGIQLTPTSWTLKHASEWINEGLLPGQDPSMVGGKTIRFYQVRRITLVRFEQWLVEQGWKAEAQVKSARVMVREIMPENRYQPKRPLATEEQVADIVARLPDFCRPEEWLPMRAIALLGWHCGMAAADILNLTHQEIRKKPGCIVYLRSKTSHHDKSPFITVRPPADLLEDLLAIPERLPIDHQDKTLRLRGGESPFLWPEYEREGDRNRMLTRFNLMLDKMGHPQLTTYSLRRAFATRTALNLGIVEAQRQLGHTTPTTTLSYIEQPEFA